MDFNTLLQTNKNNTVVDNLILALQNHLLINDLEDEEALDCVKTMRQLIYKNFTSSYQDEGGINLLIDAQAMNDKLVHLGLRNPDNEDINFCIEKLSKQYIYSSDLSYDFTKHKFYSTKRTSFDKFIIEESLLNSKKNNRQHITSHPLIDIYADFKHIVIQFRQGLCEIEEVINFYHSFNIKLSPITSNDLDWPELDIIDNMRDVYIRQSQIIKEETAIELFLAFIENPNIEQSFSQNICPLFLFLDWVDGKKITSLCTHLEEKHIDVLSSYKNTDYGDQYTQFVNAIFLYHTKDIASEKEKSLNMFSKKGKMLDKLFNNDYNRKSPNMLFHSSSSHQYSVIDFWTKLKEVRINCSEEEKKYYQEFLDKLITNNRYYGLKNSLEENNKPILPVVRKKI